MSFKRKFETSKNVNACMVGIILNPYKVDDFD